MKLTTAPALGSFAVCTVAALLCSLATRAQDLNFHNAPPSARELKNPYETLQIGTAQSLYHRRCAQCHGEDGEGLGNIPALATERAQSASAGELFWYITQGDANNGMPSWAKLSRQQRKQIITYLRVLGGSKPGSPRVSASRAEAVAAGLSAPRRRLPSPTTASSSPARSARSC